MSLRVINENQRGVLFRLGEFNRSILPGMIFSIPFFDRVIKLNLDDEIPGWREFSEEELEAKVKQVGVDKFRKSKE